MGTSLQPIAIIPISSPYHPTRSKKLPLFKYRWSKILVFVISEHFFHFWYTVVPRPPAFCHSRKSLPSVARLLWMALGGTNWNASKLAVKMYPFSLKYVFITLDIMSQWVNNWILFPDNYFVKGRGTLYPWLWHFVQKKVPKKAAFVTFLQPKRFPSN